MPSLYNCRHSGDVLERLNAKTYICPNTNCWIWQGSVVDDGYGVISFLAQQVRVHRLSFELHKGPIPSGLLICHTCDNPSCWNPDHLFTGTWQDNTRDMWNKGREGKFKRGRKLGESSKLCKREVLEIRQLIKEGILTQREIGYKYLVSDVMVSRIKLGKAWSWLT